MVRRFFATTILLTVGVLAGALLTDRLQSRSDDPSPANAPAATREAQSAAGQVTAPSTVALPDFTQIAARTSPAIVNISAVQVYRRPYFQDPFFGRLFGDESFSTRRGMSAGSGVIISSDGYVLTNNHVLGENRQTLQQVTVILSDKRERQADLVGVDPYTDLALLRIKERNLPTIAWGDSS